MAKDILLICEDAGFMTRSLIKNLSDGGLEAELTEPSAFMLGSRTNSSDGKPYMYLLYTGDYLNDPSSDSFLLMLKSLCEESGKPLVVVGHDSEIATLKRSVPSRLITYEIKRPFAMPDLINKIKNVMKKGSVTGKRKSILLVDDDIMYLKMVSSYLSDKYDVALAKSGTQAISYLSANIPDLILLDYSMPVMSGAQVMQMIRADSNYTDIPIIFLTSKSDKESVTQVMSLKPQGYILKASSQADIIKTIDNFFIKHKTMTVGE